MSKGFLRPSLPYRAGIPQALAVALAMCVATPLSAQAWLTYANDRFGATVDYPPEFSIADEPPTNSDGQRFFTADRRASLAVYGFFDVDHAGMTKLRDRYREPGTSYSYAAANATSFVLSGTRRDRIVYLRCIRSSVSANIVNCADLAYPATEARLWDPIVTRISRSLRSGRPWQ